MKDLISRQEAIEAFADMRDGYPIFHGDKIADFDIAKILSELPSASTTNSDNETTTS